MIELSVIIPSYNRAERLLTCLRALERQQEPAAHFEVIVVLDGSTDGSRRMLEAWRSPYRLRIEEQANGGPAAARNRGASLAAGSVLLFLDDDVEAAPDLIGCHLRLHRERRHAVGLGAIRIALGPRADWFAREFARGWNAHQERLARGLRTPTWEDCFGANLSVPRELFRAVGGFPVELRRAEDVMLGRMLAENGASFVHLPEAACVQQDAKTLRDYAVDFARSGEAWVRICEAHPELTPVLLGEVLDVSLREAAIRATLRRLRIPPALLAAAGAALPSDSARSRWYRFVFRFLYWRGVREAVKDSAVWSSLAHGTPILTYHAFGREGEPAGRYLIPIEKFASQMRWLKRLGFHVLSLEDYLLLRRAHRLPPANSLVITIDDGYAETATLAAPVLERLGIPATVFLVSSQIGKYNDWDADGELSGRPLLSWADVLRLRSAGFAIGAHTRTHPVLNDLPPVLARDEIHASKKELEDALGAPVRCFAYPYGEFDDATAGLADAAGFLGSCTVEGGMNTLRTPHHALRRFTIDGRWGLPRFLLTVCLGRTRVHLSGWARIPNSARTSSKKRPTLLANGR